jgi:hypothetical protein
MDTSTIVQPDEYDILTPAYISTLTDEQKTTYSTQIQSTINGINGELVIDDLDITTSENQLSTMTFTAAVSRSTLDAALVELAISDAAYLAASTFVISSINVSTNIDLEQLDSEISTLTSEYILASTLIVSDSKTDDSSISTQAAYDTVLADFYAASTIAIQADQAYINYSTIYASSLAVLDTASIVQQSTNTDYALKTSTLQKFTDEYLTLNIDYLNAQTLATQSAVLLDVATMNMSSAVVYQILGHLNADNIDLSIKLESTNALLPSSGSSPAENMANKALAETLQERLTSTINALSSFGIYASSLSLKAQETAILALGITADMYTSSINNYNALANKAAESMSSIVSTQVSYLTDAAMYDSQVLSTQRGMSSIYLIESQQNSTILSYTDQLTVDRLKLATAYLTYSSQTQLVGSFASSIANYTSSAVGYSTFLTTIDSEMVTYSAATNAAANTIKMISSQILSSQTAYIANDAIYRTQMRNKVRSTASANLYDSQVAYAVMQSQASEYEYKQAQSRFYRMSADTAFINAKVLYDTAAQLSTPVNTYESQYSLATSTLIAWNTSVSLFDTALQLFSTFVPVYTDYITKVSARVNSQKVLADAQEAADINPQLTGPVSAATEELAKTTAAELAVKGVLNIKEKQVAAATMIADSSWIGLIDTAGATAIQSTLSYYR